MAVHKVLLLCATLIPAATAWAGNTYFVGTSGSDSNPGTADKPFATIQKGLTLAQAGDAVNLLSGTYRDQSASFVRSGSTSAPITVQAAPGASVTIKGSDVISGWAKQGSTDTYVHSNYNYYFGSWGSNPADARDKARNQLFVDGAYVQEVASKSAMTPGSFYVDKTNKNLYVRLANSANPGAKTVEASVTSNALLSTNGYDNLVIRGLNFAQVANAPQDQAAVRVRNGSDHVLVDGVSVQYAAGSGISVTGSNNTIVNSRFNYNGQQGIHSDNSVKLLVKNSETSYNNTLAGKQYDPGWEAGGNKFVRSTDAVVDGLVAHDNVGSGIWFDIDNRNATIKNSISHDNGKGIHYEISYGGKIYNNLVYKNQYKNDTLNFDPSKLEPGAPMAYGIYVSSSADVEVYNNTAVYNDRSGISVTGPLRDDGSDNMVYSYAADLKNNLVAMNAAYTGGIKSGSSRDLFEFQIDNGGPTASGAPGLGNPVIAFSGNLSDHNLFYLRNGGTNQTVNSFGFNSWANQTLAEWMENTGQDATSLINNPLFINALLDDYRLAANSPALGAGVYIAGLPGSQNIGVNYDLLPVPEPSTLAWMGASTLLLLRRRAG